MNNVALIDGQPCDYLDLSPDQLRELHRELIRQSAAQMDAITEVAEALRACRQFPQAPTAGDACLLRLLSSVRSFAA